MTLQILPYTSEQVEAVLAFNRRMQAGSAPTEFLLPDRPLSPASGVMLHWTHFLVMDGDQARGGLLEMDQPGRLRGDRVRTANYQSPLSEGIIDRRYAMVGPLLVKFMESRGPNAFMVGMGAESNPLPRLLKASGWSVRSLPFLFRVHRARPFLSQIRMAHATRSRSLLAHFAASTGLGAAGFALAQRRSPTGHESYSVRVAGGWDGWADEIWEQFRPHCAFAVSRERETLEELYPVSDPRILILVVEREGKPVGWSVCFDTQMNQNRHFGNLRVGSLLDCVAVPGAMAAVAALVDRELADRGVDVVLTNLSHESWVSAFRAAGFLQGPSNYVLAMSKALTMAIGGGRVHVTRGDGDGRLNL